MHTGNHYKITEFLVWTRRDIYTLFVLATVPTVLYHCFDVQWVSIPWVPIAMIGTAAAFIIGFKNTQTYNRLWEARQIYGSIVNASRSWGIMVTGFIKDEENGKIHRELIYRHLAWLTALRFQLREFRSWENTHKIYNLEYLKYYKVPERESILDEELKPLINDEEQQYILSKKNRATHLIDRQSKALKKLKTEGYLSELNAIEMENMLVNLYEQQGKCERIKNFPYPRQFASINLFFIRLFVFVVPFGLLKEFNSLGEEMVWLNIPFSLIVTWVFTAMEKVGESTENPFEGGANDVPITALSRTIEIDLREMLNEKDIPAPLQPVNNILM